MRIKHFAGYSALALSLLLATVGCEPAANNVNINANVAATTTTSSSAANTSVSNTSAGSAALTAPDNSEIEVAEAGGVKTETRTFKEHEHVERVVVTTRAGKRTARVYARTGDYKDLPEGDVERALDATGSALAGAAGFVADKSKDAASATKEGLGKAADKTGDFASDAKDKTEGALKKTGEAAKTVGEKTVDGAKTVAEKTGDAAKTVGKKTVAGAKKVGGAVKNAVTP
ncbi:MAG: hypothetical protein WKF30_18085 [Pyrinomonadaceae bacterium]